MPTPWNLHAALAAMNPSFEPAPYKIALRSQPNAPYMSARTLAAAKAVCGRREVVLLDGVIVHDGRNR